MQGIEPLPDSQKAADSQKEPLPDQEYKLTYQEISIDTLIKFYGFGRGEAFPALVCMIFGFVNQVV